VDYFFNERQIAVRDLVRKLAAERIAPFVRECDEKQETHQSIIDAMGKGDIFRVYLPEAYGGLGGGATDLAIATEELSRVCGGIALVFAATALAATPILLGGTEEQKKRFLPPLASGEKIGAFAVTEPDSGSEAGAVKSTAVKDGDHWILNGTKQWITNAGIAETYCIMVSTNKKRGTRGASFFILDKDTPGLSFGKKEDKLGIRASSTRQVIMENCRVPADRLLGKEGEGFITAVRSFDRARPGVASQAIGIAQGALDDAVSYARTRKQFGKPIISFQGVQIHLANMATQIEAARALLYALTRMIDAGHKDISKPSAMIKLFSSEMAMKVTTDAVQVFGGYGYMREYPVEKRMRDAKITQIYEGTSEIQRNVIAMHLIREGAAKE
jgi:alkylation response protein AidB-like acyl-CoA dehydrogenase